MKKKKRAIYRKLARQFFANLHPSILCLGAHFQQSLKHGVCMLCRNVRKAHNKSTTESLTTLQTLLES